MARKRRRKHRLSGCDGRDLDRGLLAALRECKEEATARERQACERGVFKITSKLR